MRIFSAVFSFLVIGATLQGAESDPKIDAALDKPIQVTFADKSFQAAVSAICEAAGISADIGPGRASNSKGHGMGSSTTLAYKFSYEDKQGSRTFSLEVKKAVSARSLLDMICQRESVGYGVVGGKLKIPDPNAPVKSPFDRQIPMPPGMKSIEQKPPMPALEERPDADIRTAAALADAGAEFAAKGRIERAQDMLLRSLAHDLNCPIALFELGKLLDDSGDTASAANCLRHAISELRRGEREHPAYAKTSAVAKARLQKIDPAAIQFMALMEEYSQELSRIAQRNHDATTSREIRQRVENLSLATLVPPGKLPEIK